ncbi:unnamed protein product, partial [Mesorhabditis spiculigera]
MLGALLLLATAFPSFLEAVICQTCVETNGACLKFQDCGNNYCIYEKITSDSQTVVRKSCQAASSYRFDDGSVTQLTNRCIRRRTATHAYEIKICNDADHCNEDCQLVGDDANLRRCMQCTGQTDAECYGETCYGKYCTYEKTTTGNQHRIKKGCTNENWLLMPNNQYLREANMCEAGISQGTAYSAKICDDGDYCNNFCARPLPPTQNTLTCGVCSAQNVRDCSPDRYCQGAYCVYERVDTLGQVRVERRCSDQPYIQFPDGSRSQTTNQCESRTLSNGENRFIEVCNTGNFCATDCVRQPVLTTRPAFDSLVTCYECTANEPDCYTGTCRGHYCYYYLVFDRSKGIAKSHRGCSEHRELDLEGIPIDAYGQCRQISTADRVILANTCDSMDHCDSGCTQFAAALTNEVTCTSCRGAGNTCQGPMCVGKYCYYYRVYQQGLGNSVQRGCVDAPETTLPDGKVSHAYNQCDYGTFENKAFVYNTCNSSNVCDTECMHQPIPLTTTYRSPTTLRPEPVTRSAGRALILLPFVFRTFQMLF